MDRKHADPVTRPVPGVTVTGPGNAAPDPVTGSVTGRVTPSPETPAVPGNAAPAVVVPVPAVVRVGIALRYHARELWLDPGRLLYVLWNGKPESMAEHFAYMKSGAWVPEEIDGPSAKALITAGLAFHLIVAWPLKAAAKSLDAAASRPLRFAFLAVLVIAILLILGIL